MRYVRGRALAEALQQAGLIPLDCLSADVQMRPDGAVTLLYTVIVERPNLVALGRALAALGDEEATHEEPPTPLDKV